jgi:mono/diheme cytochrome c family protein
MFMDAAASFLVFLIIVALALIAPPFLDQKADPTKFFVPYPAWYFLSLFGLLGLVPPNVNIGSFQISTELFSTIIIPTIFLLVVLAIPWIDRSTVRTFGSRKGILWGTTIVVLVIVGLSIFAQLQVMAKQAAGPPSLSQAQILSQGNETTSAGGTPVSTEPGTSSGGAPTGGAAPSAQAANGAKVFSTNCSSCHGAQGQGVPGSFPPLANNPTVTGDPNKVVGILLNGLHGSITVAGATYNGQMPAWKGTLSNSDIADVITFIRSSLGNNKASAVTEAQVSGYKP